MVARDLDEWFESILEESEMICGAIDDD
jgi:hypothetical protein